MTTNDRGTDRTLEQLRQQLGDRYTIERELGRGGMGAVYLARDVRLDRLVALKVLPEEFAVQPMLRDRFLRETRTAAGFSHPNIVPVYSVEESPGLLAYSMGYVEGESLLERVRRGGPLPVREIVRLMQDVAYALAYAHGRGVVHRDIKPDNIMLERASGRAQVMDFGIARSKTAAPVGTQAGLTRVGEVVGTPEYMSPEQASGDDVDGRSDLYSLGLTVFFAVTGKNAISGETTQKVLVKQLTEQLPPVNSLRPDLPPALAEAIDRCVQKDPTHRFESAEQLVDALDVTQLVAPEVPLAIRLFQQDANTLTSMAFFFVIAAFYVWHVFDGSNIDEPLLIIILMFSVLSTRILHTMSEARRLAVAGFGADEIITGLRRVADERSTRRAELRADPRVVRARRITLVLALVQIGGAALMFRLALRFRHLVKPGLHQVEPAGNVLVITALMMLGLSIVLIFKSPLRMPFTERLFRLVWFKGPGRAFVRFTGRKAIRSATGAARSSGSGIRRVSGGAYRPTPAPISAVDAVAVSRAELPVVTPISAPQPLSVSRDDAPANAQDRVTSLEARVSALEAWRRNSPA